MMKFLKRYAVAASVLVVVGLAIPAVSQASICTGGGVGGSWGGVGGGIGCGGTGPGIGFGNPFGLPSGSIYSIIFTIVNWLLALFGLLGILGFVMSGVLYLLAASTGNDKLVDTAKDGLVWSIVGITVGLSGYIVMQVIAGLLTGTPGSY